MRTLYIVENPGLTPSHRAALIRELRGLVPLLNARIASDHVELVVGAGDAAEIRNAIEAAVGRIIDVVDITDEERPGSGDFRKFAERFNAERFWEAHAELEPVWRRSRDVAIQALIMASAAFVKLQENAPDKFVFLANESLKLLEGAPARIGCIDVKTFKKRLAEAVLAKRTFKIECS